MNILRPYQEEALARVEALAAGGVRRVLVVSPTGSGKTTVASALIAKFVTAGKRVLFLAHRREIIDQTYKRLLADGFAEADVGVLMAADARRRPGARIQVASIDTYRNRARPAADLIIIDEAHRSLAKSYRETQSDYPNALHVGLTATPFRADGKGLGEMYDELVVVATVRQLIEQGYLVNPRVLGVPQALRADLSAVRMRGHDYDERDLAQAMSKEGLVGNLIGHWQKHASGLRTVVFAVCVEHSRMIVERFRGTGVAAEHLDANTPLAERDAILGRLARGETRLLSNVNCLAEGWDLPAVKCAILARPTKSTALYLQQVGRILRPWTDPATGVAPRAIILDHAGCADEHGLPQDDRVMTLETTSRAKRQAPPPKLCPACHEYVPASASECTCGHAFFVRTGPGPLAESNEELVEKKPAHEYTAKERYEEWQRLTEMGRMLGYKDGWAFHRFKERFGAPPPIVGAGRVARVFATDKEKRAHFAELKRIAKERGYKPGYAFARYREEVGERPPVDASNETTSTDWFY